MSSWKTIFTIFKNSNYSFLKHKLKIWFLISSEIGIAQNIIVKWKIKETQPKTLSITQNIELTVDLIRLVFCNKGELCIHTFVLLFRCPPLSFFGPGFHSRVPDLGVWLWKYAFPSCGVCSHIVYKGICQCCSCRIPPTKNKHFMNQLENYNNTFYYDLIYHRKTIDAVFVILIFENLLQQLKVVWHFSLFLMLLGKEPRTNLVQYSVPGF